LPRVSRQNQGSGRKEIWALLAWFECRFDCRIQVLKTDGGLEYHNIDHFCQKQVFQDNLLNQNLVQ
jgi:hypothetical protein